MGKRLLKGLPPGIPGNALAYRVSRLPKADLKNTEVKGTEHEHNFTYYPYTVACRRSTDMALQQRMGLLSEWRRRIDSPRDHYSGINGKTLGAVLAGIWIDLTNTGSLSLFSVQNA